MERKFAHIGEAEEGGKARAVAHDRVVTFNPCFSAEHVLSLCADVETEALGSVLMESFAAPVVVID